MKKFIAITLLVDLIIVIAAVSLFVCNSNNLLEQNIVDICRILIQSTITGAITFIGLLLTFLSQEQQTKNKNQLDIRPCFIIENCSSLSAKMNQKNIPKNSNAVMCSSSTELRTVECSIVNCKNNYGLNVNIQTIEGFYKLGNIKTENIELLLVVDGTKGDEILIIFEDVYGCSYEQKIKYTYQNNNQIVFTSKQPERRK